MWFRRSASNKVISARNSQAEHAPNTYEMSSGENNRRTQMNVQSEASAPATSTKPVVNAANSGITQPSAPLLNNNPAGTGSVEERPSPVNSPAAPPVYAVVHRRQKPAVTIATDNDRTQPSESRPRSSANDFTLIDNDLYG